MAERPTSKSGGGKEGQAGAGRVEKRVVGGGGIEKRGGYPSGSRPQRAPRRCRLHSPQSLQTPPRHQSPNDRKAHPSRPCRYLIQVAANCRDVGNVALSGHPSRTAPSRIVRDMDYIRS